MGDFTVGIHDIEVSPTNSPFTDPNAGPSSPSRTILLRIFYPVAKSNHLPTYSSTWLPSFRHGVGCGYFLKLPTPLSYAVGSLMWFVKKPVVVGKGFMEDAHGVFDNKKHPVVLFSHGLG
jgi:hypothetical protein